MLKPLILVIDDDPLFRSLMKRAAKRKGVPIAICASLDELMIMSGFDVAVVDYYLDDFKEHLKGTDIAEVLASTPVILTSTSDHCVEKNEPWPQSVRRFINKRLGPEIVLDTAIRATELGEAKE